MLPTSGETTKKGAVNLALREYAARHRRVEALERAVARAKEWDYETWERLRRAEKRPPQ
jgi:hypothetical protein